MDANSLPEPTSALRHLISTLPPLEGNDRLPSKYNLETAGNRVIFTFLGVAPNQVVELQFKRDGHILGACSCQRTTGLAVCKHVNRALKETLAKGLYESAVLATVSPPERFSKLFRLTRDLPPDVIPAKPTLRPLLKVTPITPGANASSYTATLHFEYDGQVIDSESQTNHKSSLSLNLLPRDFAAEKQYRSRLSEIGFDRMHVIGRGDFWLLKAKQLNQGIALLLSEGWHVDVGDARCRVGSDVLLRVSSGIDWFDIHGSANFDGASVGLPQLLTSLQAGEKTIVLDDGSLGLIPDEWRARYGSLVAVSTAHADRISFKRQQIGLLDALLGELPNVDVDAQFDTARRRLRDFESIMPRRAPEGFGGTLRPYQEMAQGWFEFLREFGFGGCLADDMGLGKTIQVLALLESRRQQKAGPSLVVVPRSLVFNWIAEAQKFTPNLRILDQSHATRTRSLDSIREHDLILSTYGTLRKDAKYLKDMQFDYVILDESQAIKNPSTEAAKAARLLNGNHRLAMSGTPIENHLGELWSLMEFLNPGMLGKSAAFKRISTDTTDADKAARKALARAVRPFVLRRTKSQVATDLPERIEQTIQIELDPAHRKSYDELRNHYRAALKDKIEKDGVGKSQIIVLEALLRLRQSACHVGLLDGAMAGSGSAKFDTLIEQLKQIIDSGQKALVFSQFTSLLALFKPILASEKIPFEYLDGQTRDRQACVERFQKDEACKVFLISLKAGGVGLNLTAAGYVFLLDPWWNPAAEAQAIDRAHRIGQTQTVIASRLIARDTVEERVLELQKRKRDLANAIITDDNAAVSGLTRDDIELLLS
jgi:superfamily II DNA or RNA helicase